MPADFTKIIDHPEKQNIISKLVSGENSKVVSNYLKDKYSKADEAHLRIPATTLQEFLDTYADHHGFVKKIIQRDADSKIDRKIAESLMDTRAWRERVQDGVDKQLNYIEKLDHLTTIMEARAEQLFDLIQSDPENSKVDYIITKYAEILMQIIEKADKIRNDKPDVRVEHTYTLQMVEQQSFAFQETIREFLPRLGPDQVSIFFDLLNENLSKMKPKEIGPAPVTTRDIEKERQSLDKLDANVQEFDQKFLEEYKDEEEDEDESE
jgi:hypothetical protein